MPFQQYSSTFIYGNCLRKHPTYKIYKAMKKTALTLATVFVVLTITFAQSLTELSPGQLQALDLSGKYVGKRNQFSPDRKSIMQTFEYQFDLQQNDHIISGTSTIIKSNGDYADMKIRGLLVGNKLYFEEYEILNQFKDPNMVWCYKSGSLNIQLSGDQLKLSGVTNSYMADWYIPCTGGTTDLTKVDNSTNFKSDLGTTGEQAVATISNIEMAVSPNPYVESTKIMYSLPENSSISLEVFDLSGRKVAVLESNKSKNSGAYSVDFSGKSYGLSAGVFIAKLTVNGQVYSSEMVQMK